MKPDDPIEGMARAMCWADCEADPDGCRDRADCRPACWDREVHKASAAWAYALERLRRPSAAMLAAVGDRKPWIGHPDARPEAVARHHERVREAAATDMATMVRAFAREHSLEP